MRDGYSQKLNHPDSIYNGDGEKSFRRPFSKGFFACLTPCPLSLAKGEGVPPRHPAVHLAANGATPPLEGRGVFPKACCKVVTGLGTFGAVLTENAKFMLCAPATAKERVPFKARQELCAPFPLPPILA